MAGLPVGTVTFLFTDIEGSTRMIQRLGDGYRAVLDTHDRILRRAVEAHKGTVVRTEGDAFFAVFTSAPRAVAAAVAAQQDLAAQEWPEGGKVMVRMGMHTGDGTLGGEDYVGLDVHRAARIAGIAHGGQILVSDATRALAETALSQSVSLRRLGPVSLKDFEAAEVVSQVAAPDLPADFPPLRGADVRPNNLPAQPGEFIGREQETAQIMALLEEARLVTLTGPGGTGKSRLSLHVAAQVLPRFEDGVWWVPLAGVADPELVAPTVLTHLAVTDSTGRPPAEVLAEYLAERRLLLVLDNFEHLLPASRLLADLLATAPDFRALVTSQALLRLRDERVFAVPTLAMPTDAATPDDVMRYDAAALFVRRAWAADPSFQLDSGNAATVASIVNRLEGLPLAIELAAARMRLFGIEGLARRLEDRFEVLKGGLTDLPERHRALQSAIRWSYDLLDETEQHLFQALSVFAGGFTLEAAEAVGGDETIEAVASLLDKSLLLQRVRGGEARFGMLETVREFAAGLLEEAGERETVSGLHLDYLRSLAKETAPHLEGESQQVWMERLTAEHDNIRAALRFSLEAGRIEDGVRLAGSIWRFFHIGGHLVEGGQWLTDLLAQPGLDPAARGIGLHGLAGIAYWQGRREEAEEMYQEALDIYRELGDTLMVAESLFGLSVTVAWLGDLQRSEDLALQARAAYEEAGAPEGLRKVAEVQAFVVWMNGDLDRARELWTELREMVREEGDLAEVTRVGLALAAMDFQAGETERARSAALQCLEEAVTRNDIPTTLMALDWTGVMLVDVDPEGAVRIAGAAEELRHGQGGGITPASLGLPTARQRAEEVLDAATIDRLWSEGSDWSLEEAVAAANDLAGKVEEAAHPS